jgi:hypothetical protein
MSTVVDFWQVGSGSPTTLAMTAGDVSQHLLADWLPSLPVDLGPSLIGWPAQVLLPYLQNGQSTRLALCDEATRSERQWKGVLSWMLGVAGARHFLANDGYRWIAPVSAFFGNAVAHVDISGWHPDLPPGFVRTARPPQSKNPNTPDYLAVKSTSGLVAGPLQWAVVEAKGTQRALRGCAECPPRWRAQARNIIVWLDNVELQIPRHVVVATRSNPRGKSLKARRLQVRAWNNDEVDSEGLPLEAAVEVASAHLCGLFLGLRMPENARAIRMAGRRRRALHSESKSDDAPSQDILEAAETERHRRSASLLSEASGRLEVVVPTELGEVSARLSPELMTLARQLQQSVDLAQVGKALVDADRRLDTWVTSQPTSAKTTALPIGVELDWPARFEKFE